jgi:hypothetical protein
MKKDYIILGVAALAIIGGVLGFIISNNKNDSAANGSNDKQIYTAVQPCSLFTLSEAEEVLGQGAKVVQNTKPEGNNDLKLATCSYAIADLSLTGGTRIASVTVRSATTSTGAKSNQKGFDDNMTDTMTMVDGYGDHAYYDQYKGQFNIHQGHNWIIVTNGSTDYSGDKLDDAKLVADKVFN